jgi:RNA polymerase sigma-70 factor (ECF subfamily)
MIKRFPAGNKKINFGGMMSDKDFEAEVVPLRPWLLQVAAHSFSQAEPEDLAQMTLERAWKSWRTYKDDGRLKSWLRTVMRNTYINLYRAENFRSVKIFPSRFQDIGEDQFLEAEAPSAEDEVMDQDMTSEIWIALDNLLPQFRNALKLQMQGYSYQEIADFEGVPLGTIMSRIYRARAHMREALTDIVHL